MARILRGVGLSHGARDECGRKISNPAEAAGGAEPALIVGLHRDVDTALAELGLPPRPAMIGRRGSAQVWTVDDARSDKRTGALVAVVSVSDAESLNALARPLPHYGAQSYLILDGGRVIERGIWPAPGRVVRVTSRASCDARIPRPDAE